MDQTASTPQHHLTARDEKLPAIPATEKLLPLSDVESRTGFKSSFIYQLIKENKFPKPVKIGNASRWPESGVQQWIHDQISGAFSKHSKA
jgi:predicted DNA-binding transcriptional regulator AlpA